VLEGALGTAGGSSARAETGTTIRRRGKGAEQHHRSRSIISILFHHWESFRKL
jgi:hypothetical protein